MFTGILLLCVCSNKKLIAQVNVFSAANFNLIFKSFGVILWEMISRKKFFDHVTFNAQMVDLLLAGSRPDIPDDCDADYSSLIRFS